MSIPISITSQQVLAPSPTAAPERIAAMRSWASSIRTASTLSLASTLRAVAKITGVLPTLVEDAKEDSSGQQDSDPIIGQLRLDGDFECLEASCGHAIFDKKTDFDRHYHHLHAFAYKRSASHDSMRQLQLLPSYNEHTSGSIIAYVTMSGNFQCVDVECQDLLFGRKPDLLYHYDQTHLAQKVEFWCPVQGCQRSRYPHRKTKGRSFGARENKLKQHVRNFHGRERRGKLKKRM